MLIAVLIIFLLLLVIIAIFTRKNNLKNLTLENGETLLLEEDNVRVEEFFRGSDQIKGVFPSCRVRLTNRRIIVAQPIVFKKDSYALRHVISYVPQPGSSTLINPTFPNPGALKNGYLTLTTTKASISPKHANDKSVLEVLIPTEQTGLFSQPKITLAIADPEQWETMIKKVA